MNTIIIKFREIVLKIYVFCINELKIRQERRRDQLKVQKNAEKQQAVYDFMCQIRYELASAFSCQSYTCLEKIVSLYNFRILDCKEISGTYVYVFSLTKSRSGPVRTIFLTAIRDNMNRDLQSLYHDVLYNIGYNIMCTVYPILSSGMKVLGVFDYSADEVVIYVQTNLTPL